MTFDVRCHAQLHETPPLSIRKLQNIAKKLIPDHYYTKKDFIDAVSSHIPIQNQKQVESSSHLVTNLVTDGYNAWQHRLDIRAISLFLHTL